MLQIIDIFSSSLLPMRRKALAAKELTRTYIRKKFIFSFNQAEIAFILVINLI